MEYAFYYDKGLWYIWSRTGNEYRVSFEEKQDALDFLKSLVQQ